VREKESWNCYEESGGSVKMHSEDRNLNCLAHLMTVSRSRLHRVDGAWVWIWIIYHTLYSLPFIFRTIKWDGLGV